MSRMSELSLCVKELRTIASALDSMADMLATLYSSEEPVPDKPVAKPITKEEVRAELASKTGAGYGAQVRALLRQYSASQLSAVNPADYPELLLEAQAIGNEVGAGG